MIVVFHVISALFSMAFATFAFFYPSGKKLIVSYSLITSTILSGTYLVWHTKAPLLQSCLTGLIYFGIVAILTVATSYKIAASTDT